MLGISTPRILCWGRLAVIRFLEQGMGCSIPLWILRAAVVAAGMLLRRLIQEREVGVALSPRFVAWELVRRRTHRPISQE
jgi:hypothetical protein